MGLFLQGEWRRPTSLLNDEAPMDDKILAVYGFSADLLTAMGQAEDPPRQMSAAAVITTGLGAMCCCRGDVEAARALLSRPRSMPHLLSRSRVHRRRPRLTDLFLLLCDRLGCPWKQLQTDSIEVIARVPVVVCDHDRLPRAKFSQPEAYRGCMARKPREVAGLNVPRLVTKDGPPVECCRTPGSSSDGRMLTAFRCDVPEGRPGYAENAWNDEAMEDVLLEASHIQLYPLRQQDSKRPLPPSLAYVQHDSRNRIETVGSLMERMRPNTIHAVTAAGVELKGFPFVLASRLNGL
jgi:hypothetical protein